MRKYVSAVISRERQKATFWSLAIALSLMVGVYIYSLHVAVFNVAKRGAIEKSISDLNNSVADLESKYIALKKKISLDLAYSLGYTDIESTVIIPKKSVTVNTSQARTVRE